MSQDRGPATQSDFQSLAQAIAVQLGESDPQSLNQIHRLCMRLGEDAAQACLAEALAIQARGGEMLPDGSRPRTLGGIFFRLARLRLSEAAQKCQAAAALPSPVQPPPAHRQPMPWSERIAVQSILRATKGAAMSVKVLLTGRPGRVERRESTVILMLSAGRAPALPRGVPPPPAEPAPFMCYLDARQWAEVEPALADPSDELVLDGYCAGDSETGTVSIYVQSATTRNLQRAAAAFAKPRAKRTGSVLRDPSERPPTPWRTTTTTRRDTPARAVPTAAPASSPPKTVEAPGVSLRFHKGMRVRHPEFGEGDVIRSEPRGDDEAVSVDFDSAGLRRVMAGMSGLRVIDQGSSERPA